MSTAVGTRLGWRRRYSFAQRMRKIAELYDRLLYAEILARDDHLAPS
jgi:hypothetical protein